MLHNIPILYSFRRCPYAIRARIALNYAGVPVCLREVELKNKPRPMLDISPKGTVPVLVLPDGGVIDESLDVMLWALHKNDPDHWLSNYDKELVLKNDLQFKPHLDRYKYADRYPEHSLEFYRAKVVVFLSELNSRLADSLYLCGQHPSLTDIAIFPFIRQCAFVDKGWFDSADFLHLQRWLDELLNSTLFQSVMMKYKPWREGASGEICFGEK
ncbi:glutathione S-transferase [Aurantivibrio plasticivorans]